MPTKPKTEELTNRRSIEKFFKLIKGSIWSRLDTPAYKAVEDELDRLQKEFDVRPDVVRLKKKSEQLRKQAQRDYEARKADVARAERHFLAKGLTPAVLKMVAELADKYATAHTGEE